MSAVRRACIFVAAALAPALTPSTGRAETTKSFPVSATIVNGCAVATNAGGAWGTIDLGTTPGTPDATAQGSLASAGSAGIVIECTPGVVAALVPDLGNNASAGVRYLRQSGGAATIAYQLFADGSSIAWGTGSLTLPFATGVTRRTVPVRAVASFSGPRPAGTYVDTVRITLSW